MCGRYRLRRHWEQDPDDYLRLVIDRIDTDELQAGSEEARPTDRLPIIRRDEDGQLVPELRRWGWGG
jgi:putative SOS response-associated peptidase YedK